MLEESFSLFHVISISSMTLLIGITVGGMIGRSVQRKIDLKLWGPFLRRKRKGR